VVANVAVAGKAKAVACWAQPNILLTKVLAVFQAKWVPVPSFFAAANQYRPRFKAIGVVKTNLCGAEVPALATLPEEIILVPLSV